MLIVHGGLRIQHLLAAEIGFAKHLRPQNFLVELLEDTEIQRLEVWLRLSEVFHQVVGKPLVVLVFQSKSGVAARLSGRSGITDFQRHHYLYRAAHHQSEKRTIAS